MANTWAVGDANASATGPDYKQELTISSFGVPDYVHFIVTRATSTGTSTTHETVCEGHCEIATGYNQWCTTIYNKNSTGSAVTDQVGSSARCILIVHDTMGFGSGLVESYAIVTGTVTDGIEITWNSGAAPSLAYEITYTFHKGDSLIVDVGVATINATEDGTVSPTFTNHNTEGEEPEVILVGGNYRTPAQWSASSLGSDALITQGIVRNTTGLPQLSISNNRADGAATQTVGIYATSDATTPRCIKHAEDGTSMSSVECTSIGSGTATFTTRDQSGAAFAMGYVALSWQGTANIHVEEWALNANGTGNKSVTFVGFEFELMLAHVTAVWDSNRDSLQTGGPAPPCLVAVSDGTNSRCHSHRADQGVTVMDATVQVDDQLFWMPRGNNSSVDWAATLVSVDSTGLTYNVATSSGDTHAAWALFLADAGAAGGGLEPVLARHVRRQTDVLHRR